MQDRMKAEKDRAPLRAPKPESAAREMTPGQSPTDAGYLRAAHGNQRASAMLKMQRAVCNRAVQRQVERVQRFSLSDLLGGGGGGIGGMLGGLAERATGALGGGGGDGGGGGIGGMLGGLASRGRDFLSGLF